MKMCTRSGLYWQKLLSTAAICTELYAKPQHFLNLNMCHRHIVVMTWLAQMDAAVELHKGGLRPEVVTPSLASDLIPLAVCRIVSKICPEFGTPSTSECYQHRACD